MTAAQIVADLKNMIGPSSEVDDAGLLVWVNDAYLSFCDEITKVDPEYFAATYSISTVSGTQEYDLPSDFDKMVAVTVSYDGTNYVKATPMPSINYMENPSSPSGIEEDEPKYYLFADKIGLAPIPAYSGSNNLKLYYTSNPGEMIASDTPAIPAKYHHLIKYGAYANYLDQDDEHVYAERMRKNFELKMYNAVESMTQRQVDEPKMVAIVQDQDFYTDSGI